MAAFFALKSFASLSRKIAIRIFIDNTTAICYINKGGGTRSSNLTMMANQINKWCESKSISLEAVYLPGKLNVIADEESRALGDSSD